MIIPRGSCLCWEFDVQTKTTPSSPLPSDSSHRLVLTATMSTTALPLTSRRSNTIEPANVQPLGQKIQPQQQPNLAPIPPPKDAAAAAPPPLPRQNSKAVPNSPPRLIKDVNRAMTFTRVGFLGEVRRSKSQLLFAMESLTKIPISLFLNGAL